MGKYAKDVGEFELRSFNLNAMGYTLLCPKCGTKHTRAGGSQRAYSWQCMRCDYCFNADESRLTPVNKQNALTRAIIDDREEKAGEPDTQEGEKEEMATRMTKAEAEKRAAELGKGHNIARDKYGHYFVLGPKGDTFVPEIKNGEMVYDPNQHLKNVVAEPTPEQLAEGEKFATKVVADAKAGKTQKTAETTRAEMNAIGRAGLDEAIGIGHIVADKLMAIFPEHQKNQRWLFTPEDVEKVKKALLPK